MTAQAAEPAITLACRGTVTPGGEDAKPEPVSMGIIVNFMDRTVQGFGSYPVKITVWNDVNVEFNGTNDHKLALRRTIGIMDRVTGDVDATSTMTNTKTDRIVSSLSYALKCKPTQRMF